MIAPRTVKEGSDARWVRDRIANWLNERDIWFSGPWINTNAKSITIKFGDVDLTPRQVRYIKDIVGKMGVDVKQISYKTRKMGVVRAYIAGFPKEPLTNVVDNLYIRLNREVK